MLLGNYSVIHKSPGKFFGGTSVSNVSANFGKNGQLRAIYSAESVPDQWGLPVGYYSGWMLPRKSGYVVGYSDNVLNSTANPVMGVNGVGNCDITLTALADLSLVVSSAGTCNIVVTATGQTIGTIYGAGTSNITLSATGTVGAIAFGNGQGSISLAGNANIAAKGFMTGSMNPFTELSPEGLAKAVWSALATENNTSGTMGSKLNTASSGGIDMNALAQAVWEYATRTLTSGGSGGATPQQIWEYTTRTLTESAGLTIEQDEKLTRIDERVDIKVSDSYGGGGRSVTQEIKPEWIKKLMEDQKEEIIETLYKEPIESIDLSPILDKIDSIEKNDKIDKETLKKVEKIEKWIDKETIKEKKEEEKEKKHKEKKEREKQAEQQEILEKIDGLEKIIMERKQIESDIDSEEIQNILKLLK